VIPSLVAQHLRRSIVEYLSTTFALADDETRHGLADFLADSTEGIFRGPYLRVRTPFVQVDDGWTSPLDWNREGWRPFVHQANAWARLTSFGHEPEPTLVTTGTGSGKTECFLYPILDHCRREAAKGRGGIKALILYPMNALATDQARRLAELLHEDESLSGVSAGLYIGGEGRHKKATPGYLVDHGPTIQDDPPDILLTNYKMLDRLLVRADRTALWAGNGPDTLQYVVLDEFHTYDGAQGTDVAMLLRRLGRRLSMATPEYPLGAATPVATSATLGSGSGSTDALREFAGRVFGADFDPEAVIGEFRQTAEEACGAIDYTLPTPRVEDVAEIDELDPDAIDAIVAAFTGRTDAVGPEELGDILKRHHLTRSLLAACGDRSRSWDEVRTGIVARLPDWGPAAQADPAAVDLALARFVALLSIARRARGRPLFPIEVQLWIREVSRLLRSISVEPEFRWLDSSPTDDDVHIKHLELPAVYCRHCGRAGWMGLTSELNGTIKHNPRPVYEAAVKKSPQLRAIIRASADEPDVRWLSVIDGQLYGEGDGDRIPVLVTGADDPARAEERAERSECPSCRIEEGITFLGSRVASLASVSISQLFGMSEQYVADDERKLLAFAGSVQDASHRAAFFSGRTHRFNLRTAMAQEVVTEGAVPLSELGARVLQQAEHEGLRNVFALIPPDLTRDRQIATLWTDTPNPAGRARLEQRLALEAHLELGLRSRLGRTLELSGALVAGPQLDGLDDVIELVAEAHAHQTGQMVVPGTVPGYEPYLLGLLARLRSRGAIVHPWLHEYIQTDGDTWHVWGGRPDGMPAFPSGQSRPTFVTTGPSKTFDSLATAQGTWLIDWAARTLGVSPAEGRELNQAAFRLLAEQGLVQAIVTSKGSTAYGLDPARIEVLDVADPDDEDHPTALRCDVCIDRFGGPSAAVVRWSGQPCLRFRCPGRYRPAPVDDANYYRHLYRTGVIRRVVSKEHTGLLTRKDREDLEEQFKNGTAPDAPNVITATPTLEMGIDIGDLSAVMLMSVPHTQASYVQRVGRAGRATGNSLVTTFARTDPRNLYYLANPEAMIAGEVRPPNCYLDATEILRRQYAAYLVDRAADGTVDAPPMPYEIGATVEAGMAPDGWLRAVLDATHDRDADHVGGFLALFAGHLALETVEDLRTFAEVGLEKRAEAAIAQWKDLRKDFERRRNRLGDAIKKLDAKTPRTEEEDDDLRRLTGERKAVVAMLQAHRNEYTINALERLGLLPNYTLVDDAVTLTATLWWKDDDGNYETDETEYDRSGSIAISEFAPGNNFYVGGHKLTVDSLDVGTASEPLHEAWRLCPECGFGAPEKNGEAPVSCPRCGQVGIADAGCRHQLVRLRQVFSSASEEAARVFDETDERDKRLFDVVTSVDVDPKHVKRAYEHTTVAFGMEYASSGVIRQVNFGLTDKPGEKITVAGAEINATRFSTCQHCGAVQGTRRLRAGQTEFHQGWCITRTSNKKANLQPLALFHDLHTEVVRLLLPVSTFEVEERLSSFKAALLLGLRLDFGGDPDNLDVALSDFPNPGGQGRRRFLVLHDRVPGGTGYVERVADPERLGAILIKAREFISRCACRDEGRAACHRCLLGACGPHEIEFVSRAVALDLLDELLRDWSFQPAAGGTVAAIALSGVDESELERRFKVALNAWAQRPDNEALITVVPQPGAADAMELRLGAGEDATRYLIREQIEANAVPQSVPDFTIERLDGRARPIAVYLDGFEFHASATHNNIAHDAAKRSGVRATGSWVWNLTWDDVKAFHEAVTAAVPKVPPPKPLLSTVQRGRAEQLHHTQDGRIDLRAVDHNPMQLLLELLADPDPDAWERLALSAIGGGVAGAPPIQVAPTGVRPALEAALAGHAPAASDGDLAALAFRWETLNGLPLSGLLDCAPPHLPNEERWTVVARLPDDEDTITSPSHPDRWRDWLQWANLLQFVGATGEVNREAVMTSATHAQGLDVGDLMICPAPRVDATVSDAPIADSPEKLTTEMTEELDLLVDEEVLMLVTDALVAGAPLFVAGYEPEGAPGEGLLVEAAWPAARVAVLDADTANDESLCNRLRSLGWDARPTAEWTAADLVTAIHQRME
jgi:replicative superfamily II helicase